MLGYRSLFQVPGSDGDVLDQAIREFRHWLSTKPYRTYDGDSPEFGVPCRFAEDATALLIQESLPDGTRSVRATLSEVNPAGRWTTQLTASAPRHRPPWVWIDVDAPAERADGSQRRQWTSTPNLAKALLAELGATDGTMALGTRPERVFVDDIDRLVEIICDPDRRGLAFLAGTPEGLPIDRWIELVHEVLRDTAGLAGAFVMDAAATAAFAEAVGDTHAVPPGTIRTFRAAADPASALDARRHRILSTERLVNDEARYLRRLLGWRAREAGTEQPLPRDVSRLDARLEALTNQLLVARAAPPPPVTEQPTSAALDIDLTAPAEPTEVAPSGASVVAEAEMLSLLAAAVREATGAEVPPEDVVQEVLRLVGAQAQLTARLVDEQALTERLEALTARLEEANAQLAETMRRLEDEQVDHAQTTDELYDVTRSRDHLRVELTRLGSAHAWVDVVDTAPARPETFGELVERFDEPPHLVFTGDPEQAISLDDYEPLGRWAGKAWEALQAAEGYAVAKAEGDFSGGMDTYLQQTPAGYCGYSSNRHARDESEQVRANDRFRRLRMFSVPARIDRNERAFMGAHFKIAQFGMISPRLHYLDATAIDGKVYVGYLGPHLPTGRTN